MASNVSTLGNYSKLSHNLHYIKYILLHSLLFHSISIALHVKRFRALCGFYGIRNKLELLLLLLLLLLYYYYQQQQYYYYQYYYYYYFYSSHPPQIFTCVCLHVNPCLQTGVYIRYGCTVGNTNVAKLLSNEPPLAKAMEISNVRMLQYRELVMNVSVYSIVCLVSVVCICYK